MQVSPLSPTLSTLVVLALCMVCVVQKSVIDARASQLRDGLRRLIVVLHKHEVPR